MSLVYRLPCFLFMISVLEKLYPFIDVEFDSCNTYEQHQLMEISCLPYWGMLIPFERLGYGS